ncbi:alpha/beta fold hydrolase [Kibdelosporangium phytohabitans]|uniref:alpha/beta fold hydrolase n=1 Tax=Kibdelosporangium phytohabitans TaxID=860235 RepID=UPI003AAD4356
MRRLGVGQGRGAAVRTRARRRRAHSRRPRRRWEHGLRRHIDDVSRLLDDQAILVGHSYGGMSSQVSPMHVRDRFSKRSTSTLSFPRPASPRST